MRWTAVIQLDRWVEDNTLPERFDPKNIIDSQRAATFEFPDEASHLLSFFCS